MIKRRFYKLEHGDKDAPSESSSSDSDSEAEAEEMEEEVEYDDDDDDDESEEENVDHKDNGAVTETVHQNVSVSSPSGYESEDSSGNEVIIDKSDVLTSDDETGTQIDQNRISQSHLSGKGIQHKTMSEEPDIPCGNSDYILKCKSVFKCRICPRVVCLSDETLRAHLNSKRHARSEKLLKEGRLKLMLDDRGRIDGEEEHSPKIEQKKTETTKTKGLKKQRKGKRQRKENEQSGTQTGRHRTKNQAKRSRKDD